MIYNWYTVNLIFLNAISKIRTFQGKGPKETTKLHGSSLGEVEF